MWIYWSVSFNEIDEIKLEKSNIHSHCRGPDNISNVVGKDDVCYNLWFNRLAILDLAPRQSTNGFWRFKFNNYV